MKIKKPNQHFKYVLECLGENYLDKVIDYEHCVYRKINNRYDIEISGVNTSKRKKSYSIYVWETSPGLHVIEEIFDVKSISSLKRNLYTIVEKYKLM